MWDWLEDTRSSLWFDVRLFVWIAQDGFGRPYPHHEAVGNSPAEALYMLMVQYMVVPMPKKRDGCEREAYFPTSRGLVLLYQPYALREAWPRSVRPFSGCFKNVPSKAVCKWF